MRPKTFKVFALLAAFVILVSSSTAAANVNESPFEADYWHLYDLTEDKTGLESIRVLHKQLDDDNDGTIEPAETCDFIRDDLVREEPATSINIHSPGFLLEYDDAFKRGLSGALLPIELYQT